MVVSIIAIISERLEHRLFVFMIKFFRKSLQHTTEKANEGQKEL